MCAPSFEERYGNEFETMLAEAKHFLDNPDLLREDIARKKIAPEERRLPLPQPDQFAYRTMNYRGFVHHPERLRNYILVKQGRREEGCECLPVMLDVEPESRCNFRCIMCARAFKTGAAQSAGRSMDLKSFKRLLDSNPHLMEVKIQGIGEPLLNPDLFDMIRYATERHIWVRTTVNGSLLHKNDNFKRLVDSDIGEIQTSFDGADKATFESIRRGANFESIVANLTRLNAYVTTKERDYTRMWVLLQTQNRHQLQDFVTLAAQMGFRRLTYSVALTGWGEEEQFNDLKIPGISEEEEARVLEQAAKEGVEVSIWRCTDRFRTDSPETICPIPFIRAFVSSDLRIIPCGTIGHLDDVNYGSALEFAKHWNSEGYRAFRRAHLSGNIPSYCRECYDLDDQKR